METVITCSFDSESDLLAFLQLDFCCLHCGCYQISAFLLASVMLVKVAKLISKNMKTSRHNIPNDRSML